MLSKRAKDEYWDKIIFKDFSKRTLEELEISLEASIDLEISDLGSSGFDIAFSSNPSQFDTIINIQEELITRNILTAEELKTFILGCNNCGRIINQYSLSKWILQKQ